MDVTEQKRKEKKKRIENYLIDQSRPGARSTGREEGPRVSGDIGCECGMLPASTDESRETTIRSEAPARESPSSLIVLFCGKTHLRYGSGVGRWFPKSVHPNQSIFVGSAAVAGVGKIAGHLPC